VEEHLQLANVAEQVLLRLAQSDAVKSVEVPMLIHRDLHKRNIFVSSEDPTQITCLIDWQSSSVEPVHHYSDETPDLCDLVDTSGEFEDEDEDAASKARQKALKSASICRQTWDVMIAGFMRDLHKARIMDQDILRIFRYVPAAWRHGAVAIREDLMKLSERWSDPLSLPGTCPYQPSADEIARHKILLNDFHEAHSIRRQLIDGFHTDEEGWVPIDRWDIIREEHDVFYREWLMEVVRTGELMEDKARKMWPFDTEHSP